MKIVYRVLAYAIAAAVAIQAAAIAYGIFGLGAWIQGGGTLDKAAMESESTSFPGLGGLMLHGMSGIMFIPALTLLLLISSFFTKVKGSILWALYTVAAVLVQVALGIFAREVTGLGALHGFNALILFMVAWTAARRISRAATPAVSARDESVPVSV